MKSVLILFLAVLYLYLTLGSDADVTKTEKKAVKTENEVNDVFTSENLAKGFIKDKRAPSPGGFLFRRRYHRPHRYHHGYHRNRYYKHKSREEYEEMEEGRFFFGK
ncbi:hypothetical protein SNE40_010677 [Patella caerulea]|uniref:Uncharacterized protein n=1 Tax=Patella caerulea TaxID=87958 RepID=A0AAN8JUY2_PATCE